MPAALNLSGAKLGRLTGVRRTGTSKHGRAIWLFRCECGGTIKADPSLVKKGSTRSCGCLLNESRGRNARAGAAAIAKAKTKHGQALMSGEFASEYAIWKSMRQRCLNSRCVDYPAYGGRGITVCESWGDFSKFIEDMGPRPSTKHSLDRINNGGDYEPANCRWATPTQQANNRRKRGSTHGH